jgi:ATP-dependent DNA helicase RecG
MQAFLAKKYHIMVATTVIEVGVNVPNAPLMVIESAERFGLSQLHQLRGRVGRGGDQSYCVLITGEKLSEEGRVRMRTMCETNDGFKIAEVDLQLRGPGEIEGTRQSGDLQFKIADLSTDQALLYQARQSAIDILQKDPNLHMPEHFTLNRYLQVRAKSFSNWSQIS